MRGSVCWLTRQTASRKDRKQSKTRQREERDVEAPETRLGVDAHCFVYLFGRGRSSLQHLLKLVVADKRDIVEIDLRLELCGIVGLPTSCVVMVALKMPNQKRAGNRRYRFRSAFNLFGL